MKHMTSLLEYIEGNVHSINGKRENSRNSDIIHSPRMGMHSLEAHAKATTGYMVLFKGRCQHEFCADEFRYLRSQLFRESKGLLNGGLRILENHKVSIGPVNHHVAGSKLVPYYNNRSRPWSNGIHFLSIVTRSTVWLDHARVCGVS